MSMAAQPKMVMKKAIKHQVYRCKPSIGFAKPTGLVMCKLICLKLTAMPERAERIASPQCEGCIP